jgi:hypothetical protein
LMRLGSDAVPGCGGGRTQTLSSDPEARNPSGLVRPRLPATK